MAVAARSFVQAATEAGLDVAIVPVSAALPGRAADSGLRSLYLQNGAPLPHPVTVFLDSPPVIGQLQQSDPRLFAAPVNALLPFWELTRMPPSWAPVFNAMDAILAPSTFVAQSVACSFPAAIRPVPLVTQPMDVSSVPRRPSLPQGFIFFGAFDVLSSVARKNPGAIIEAFIRAFAGRSDVHLVLKSWQVTNVTLDAAALAPILERHKNVHLITDDLSAAEMAALYRDSDAFVSLHRAEGLGLGILEAMSFGRPAVATDYSGSVDFVDETNGCPVKYRLVPVQAPESIFSPEFVGASTTWADPDIDDAVRQMRRLVEDREHYARLSKCAVATIARRRAEFQRACALEPLFALAEEKRETRILSRSARHRAHFLLEGEFGTPLSLAHINRELGRRLARQRGLNFLAGDVGRSDGIPLPAEMADSVIREYSPDDVEADVRLWHLWPPQWQRRRAGHYAVMQPWEFGEIPKAWRDALKSAVDAVWVNTTFVRDMYVRGGVDPGKIALLPLGIDTAILNPQGPKFELNSKRSFRFLYVGGTIIRKGADIAANAYLREFTRSDDVVLVIKDIGGKTVYAGQNFGEQLRAFAGREDLPEIEYIDETLDDASMAALYRSCDVLLAPYRGEGFGLPILEGMACGLMPIVTAGGASDDFVTDDYGWRIPSARVALGDRIGDHELVGQGWFLQPDEGELQRVMRAAYADADRTRHKGAAAAGAARAWSWENAAIQYAQHIQKLRSGTCVKS